LHVVYGLFFALTIACSVRGLWLAIRATGRAESTAREFAMRKQEAVATPGPIPSSGLATESVAVSKGAGGGD
jgi:hypothetical protein